MKTATARRSHPFIRPIIHTLSVIHAAAASVRTLESACSRESDQRGISRAGMHAAAPPTNRPTDRPLLCLPIQYVPYVPLDRGEETLSHRSEKKKKLSIGHTLCTQRRDGGINYLLLPCESILWFFTVAASKSARITQVWPMPFRS